MKAEDLDLRLQKLQQLTKEEEDKQTRSGLSLEDFEDILGEAKLSVLNLSPDSSEMAVSLCFTNSLNEARKRLASDRRRAYPYQPADDYRAAWKAFRQQGPEESGSSESEYVAMEIRMLEVVRKLKGFLTIAVERQSPRDRALLAEEYGLDQVGFRSDPSLLAGLSRCAKKQALWRARRRFLKALAHVLEEAAKDPLLDLQMITDVLKLIDSGLLGDAMLVYQRHFGKD
jgi:hypothetical protein